MKPKAMWKTIVLKRADTARCCGQPVGAGDRVRWHPSKGVEHLRGQCDRSQLEEGGAPAPELASVPEAEGVVKVVPLRAAKYAGWSARQYADGSWDAVSGVAVTTCEPTFHAAVAAIALCVEVVA